MSIRWKPYPSATPQRCQIPAYTDRWMMGDRYGEIVGYSEKGVGGSGPLVRVKLDKSGKLFVAKADDCKMIEGVKS